MGEKRYVGLGDLQLPILVLIFLLCLSVLLPLFSGCWEMSTENSAKNTAVQLCRSAAEAFAAVPEAESVSRLLGGNGETSLPFNSRGELCGPEDAALLLSVRVDEESVERGVLRRGEFSAIRDGQVLYALTSFRYVPEGGERHG